MPKKENTSRLKKRQKKYLEKFNVFANAPQEDPLYAEKKEVSINQFVVSAVTEKITALDTEKYIENRGIRGSKEKYLDVLKKVPHVQPRQDDVIDG